MAQYVKFLRGTMEAYTNATKNADTLYFVTEQDQSNGRLYLGEKLLTGVADLKDFSVGALKDVLLSENIANDSLLVYDSVEKAWVNKTIDEQFPVFGAVNPAIPGLVPGVTGGETNLFLKSDGTWAAIELPDIKVDHDVKVITNDEKATHTALIATATEGKTPIGGDYIIIKDLIGTTTTGEKLYQHTAYLYHNNEWKALDGNYNAENVYFDEDLMTTSAIGNITLTNGQATIAAAGKNLKQVFETIFVKEKNPTVTTSSVSVSAANNKAYEVGTKVTPVYSGSYSAGSYEFGPATGITASNWKATDSNSNTVEGQSGSFDELTVTDGINYTITVSADLTEGAIPLTNLGNEYAAGKIAGGTKTSSKSAAITGYRRTFYGTLNEKTTLTSAVIRGLSGKSTKALSNGSTFDITIPVGCLRVVFAYPSGLQDVSSVLDANDSNANIVSAFTKTLVNVEGAEGYTTKEYKVYSIDFANPYDAANTYKVTI